MKKDLTRRLIEALSVTLPPMGNYTSTLMADLEKMVKPLLNAAELTAYNSLSPDDKSLYLGGFISNVNEWKNAKYAANNPQLGQNNGGGSGLQQDDGLDHWQPASKTNDESQGQEQTGNEVFKDAENEIEEAENKIKESLQNGDNSNNNSSNTKDPQLIANNALDIANSAREIANAAKSAAEAAQNAADQADNNARTSGKESDIQNADKAQEAADKAWGLAEEAKRAADEAQRAANEAQQAADNGDANVAGKAAKDAFDSMKEAANKAKAAQINAKNAINNSKQTSQSSGLEGEQQGSQSQDGQQGGSQLQGGLQGGSQSQGGSQGKQLGGDDSGSDPVLLKSNTDVDMGGEFIHDEPFNPDSKWGGNDFFGDDEEMRELAKQIAEEAGLPLTGDDLQSPNEYAGKKWAEAQKALASWQPHQQPGKDGNPPTYIKEVMAKLFESAFDWRALIEQFMTDKYPENIVDVWAKRRMGVDPSHPFYKGRYLHPNEEFEEKRSGLAQVFFLVDASGSMGVKCGDGIDIFEHIMSELIQIELAAKIKYSAYATFNTGLIDRDDIFTWTYQDACDEDELLEQFILPQAGGGTSAVQGIQSIQEYDDVYSTSDPWTLLIVVTDGGDDYDGLSDIVNDPDQMENMIWVITATSDQWFESKRKELQALGVPEDHIICIDINKEWGVDESQVKRS